MGLGVWTTVEGNVYPSTGRYGGGFQWMVVDEDRTSTNQSRLRIRPYIKKVTSVSDSYAAYNLSYQSSYFQIDDADKKNINTRFDFREASVGTVYVLNTESLPFQTNAGNEYVEYAITHDSSGAKTVKITGYIKGEASSSHFQYVKTTASVTLPRINKASVISVADTPIGGVMKLYLNRPSTDSEDYITAYVGNKSYSISTGTHNTYIEWVVPDEVYALIPTAKQIECRILCETYSGTTGTFLGSSSATVNLYVDKVPSFNAVLTTDNPSSNKTLVKNVDAVTVSFQNLVSTPSANGGGTFYISDGRTVFRTQTATYEKAAGEEYQLIFTDGRNISKSVIVSPSAIIPYEIPAIGSASAGWDLETEELEISFSGKWYAGSFAGYTNNSGSVYVRVAEKGTTTYTTKSYSFTNTETAGIKNFSGRILFAGLDPQKSYDVLLYATDTIYSYGSTEYPPTAYAATASKAVPIFMWCEDTFRINGNLEVTGTYPGGSGGGSADMSGYLPLSGGTMTGELRVDGGDTVSGSKFVLVSGSGNITDSGTATLLGFLNSTDLAVGHSSYNTVMRGKASRPTYNGKEVALMSDIETMLAEIDNALGGI